MILRRDINVVHIQQNAAIGQLDDFAQELPFRHFGSVVFGVTADVLDTDRHLQVVARRLNFLGRMACHGKSVRHRQQVMRITAIDASPAEMIGKPRSIGVFNQPFETFEMLPVKFVGRAEIDRHTVLDDSVLFEDRVKHLEWTTSIDHEIFRNYFKPIDDRFLPENVPVMWNTQANSDAVVRKSVKSVCGHNLWDLLTN